MVMIERANCFVLKVPFVSPGKDYSEAVDRHEIGHEIILLQSFID